MVTNENAAAFGRQINALLDRYNPDKEKPGAQGPGSAESGYAIGGLA